jgi:hypothetical protein
MNATFASAMLTVLAAGASAQSLVVHEWGTFTSFQDEQGRTIPGINVDDEPVPKFVHRLGDIPIFTTHSSPASWSQGTPRCHPDVTLRLETPVLYFYPQKDFPLDRSFDVVATLAGGWLTEFFPFAATEGSGFPRSLESATRGSIRWKGLRLARDSAVSLPETTQHVWLAPRKVNSAVVISSDKAEAEKYLFYRGVGHVDAPVVVRLEASSLSVSLRDGETLLQTLPRMWVVHVFEDGRLAYRAMRADQQRSVTASLPSIGDTAPSQLNALRGEIKATLTAEGLYEDEADAMLATWRLSYFESAGLRVFFVLPRSWTDARLPLRVSTSATITRVMLGRVELISPQQRAALDRLYELPATAFAVNPLYYEDDRVLKHVSAGTASHADLYRIVGREVPDSLRLYESMGRFRDALLAHERRSSRDLVRSARLDTIISRFSSCLPGSPSR